MSYFASLMFRTGAKSLCLTHVLLTSTSLLHGRFGGNLDDVYDDAAYGGGSSDKSDPAGQLLIWLPQLDELVRDMYGGRGIHKRYVTSSSSSSGGGGGGGGSGGAGMGETFLRLERDVTFEDAAAICRGDAEVVEAFRALGIVRPESLITPRRVEVGGMMPQHADLRITYHLHQRYAGLLTVRSLLVVDVALGERGGDNVKDVSSLGMTPTARVVKFQERWNGVEPLDWKAVCFSRRVNGLASWFFTSLVVPGRTAPNDEAETR